jgi:hypothetical protein
MLFCAVTFTSAFAGDFLATLEKGDVQLSSIGPINFGPEGILFVADPKGSTVYAIDTGDRSKAPVNRKDIKGLNGKIASLLGTSASELIISDLALNPISGNAYLSVSRGRGPEAHPVLIRLSTDGAIEAVDLEGVKYAKASLWSAPDKDRRGRDIRQDAITEIAYVNESVVVAGLSNQEFSSRLRVLPFPFDKAEYETGLEIYHTSHGQWETHSPIRTFTPIIIDEESHILAAHTCTPLVTIPISDILAKEDKVIGSTIAELGNRNRPLDMLVYEKAGEDFLLITNSSRGVMKLAMAPVPSLESLTTEVPDTAGMDIERIDAFEGAVHVEPWGDGLAVALVKSGEDVMDLTTIPLP